LISSSEGPPALSSVRQATAADRSLALMIDAMAGHSSQLSAFGALNPPGHAQVGNLAAPLAASFHHQAGPRLRKGPCLWKQTNRLNGWSISGSGQRQKH